MSGMTPERRAEIRERVVDRVTGLYVESDRRELLAEVDRLHSWDGLMSLLNEHWPDWLFVTAPQPEDYKEPLYHRIDNPVTEDEEYVRANPGVMITGLIRWVDRLRAQVAALTSALERTEANFRAAVRSLPVRDMAENLAENRAALASGDEVQS